MSPAPLSTWSIDHSIERCGEEFKMIIKHLKSKNETDSTPLKIFTECVREK